MCATEEPAGSFDPVPNYSARTVITGRREPLNRTFETIERVPRPVENDLKSLVVLIPAHFALGHRELLISIFGLLDPRSC